MRGLNRGRVICLLPKWDWLKEKPFAAQYILGVTLAASECGYAVESRPYLSVAEIQESLAHIHRDRYAGVLWANPDEESLLAQLVASGVRVVTSLRHFPSLTLPHTVDDFSNGYARAAALLFQRGVRRIGVLSCGQDDQTYEPALQVLLKEFPKAGIEVPQELICRARCKGLDDTARTVLLRSFLAQRDHWDGCWAFAPGILDQMQDIASAEKIDLGNRIMAVQRIRAAPLHHANLVLESDVQAHGREAFRLLHEWIETGHRPMESLIPLDCSDKPRPPELRNDE
jgi:DNA-binding LacI/PurR family transcriptional regulator